MHVNIINYKSYTFQCSMSFKTLQLLFFVSKNCYPRISYKSLATYINNATSLVQVDERIGIYRSV
jgi:hypothetical protein